MTTTMTTRSIHIKKVNLTKSAEVRAMLDLLTELDSGGGGDFDGFENFGIINAQCMKGRLNSYQAQKIAKYLGKNISKSHLIKFSKNERTLIKRDLHIYDKGDEFLNRISVDEFIKINGKGLLAYWQCSKEFYINNALI